MISGASRQRSPITNDEESGEAMVPLNISEYIDANRRTTLGEQDARSTDGTVKTGNASAQSMLDNSSGGTYESGRYSSKMRPRKSERSRSNDGIEDESRQLQKRRGGQRRKSMDVSGSAKVKTTKDDRTESTEISKKTIRKRNSMSNGLRKEAKPLRRTKSIENPTTKGSELNSENSNKKIPSLQRRQSTPMACDFFQKFESKLAEEEKWMAFNRFDSPSPSRIVSSVFDEQTKPKALEFDISKQAFDRVENADSTTPPNARKFQEVTRKQSSTPNKIQAKSSKIDAFNIPSKYSGHFDSIAAWTPNAGDSPTFSTSKAPLKSDEKYRENVDGDKSHLGNQYRGTRPISPLKPSSMDSSNTSSRQATRRSSLKNGRSFHSRDTLSQECYGDDKYSLTKLSNSLKESIFSNQIPESIDDTRATISPLRRLSMKGAYSIPNGDVPTQGRSLEDDKFSAPPPQFQQDSSLNPVTNHEKPSINRLTRRLSMNGIRTNNPDHDVPHVESLEHGNIVTELSAGKSVSKHDTHTYTAQPRRRRSFMGGFSFRRESTSAPKAISSIEMKPALRTMDKDQLSGSLKGPLLKSHETSSNHVQSGGVVNLMRRNSLDMGCLHRDVNGTPRKAQIISCLQLNSSGEAIMTSLQCADFSY